MTETKILNQDINVSHTALGDIGTNAHSTIDSHIAASSAHGASGDILGATTAASTYMPKTGGQFSGGIGIKNTRTVITGYSDQIAADGNVNYGAEFGLLVVVNSTDGTTGVFTICSTGTFALLSDPSSTFATDIGATGDNHIRLHWDGSTYRLYNRFASAKWCDSYLIGG